MKVPRIAIASPNAAAWSETFIKAHMDYLPGVVLILSDGDLPKQSSTGIQLNTISRSQRIKRRLGKELPLNQIHVENIANLLQEKEIDIVLAEFGPCGSEMLASCEMAGIPLVTHFHGYDAFRDDALNKVKNYEMLFGSGAGFVVVSNEMETQLLSLGAPKGKVFYNCYGVKVAERNADFVPVAARAPHFMGIGRFVDKKMPVLSILAFHDALRTNPDLKLTIAGDGPQWGACKALVKAYGLEDAISLPGRMPHNEVLELFNSCRGFIQHSVVSFNNDHEGTPLAILEAMAAGVAVISTRHAGIVDQVEHKVTGLLCDEFDIAQMTKNILEIANSPVLAEAYGTKAREHISSALRMDQSITRLHDYLIQCASQ